MWSIRAAHLQFRNNLELQLFLYSLVYRFLTCADVNFKNPFITRVCNYFDHSDGSTLKSIITVVLHRVNYNAVLKHFTHLIYQHYGVMFYNTIIVIQFRQCETFEARALHVKCDNDPAHQRKA